MWVCIYKWKTTVVPHHHSLLCPPSFAHVLGSHIGFCLNQVEPSHWWRIRVVLTSTAYYQLLLLLATCCCLLLCWYWILVHCNTCCIGLTHRLTFQILLDFGFKFLHLIWVSWLVVCFVAWVVDCGCGLWVIGVLCYWTNLWSWLGDCVLVDSTSTSLLSILLCKGSCLFVKCWP